MITNVPGSAGTTAQQRLVYQGQKSVISASPLARVSLANGQTFDTITPAGAADSRTINAALAASTDLPTFCAALANDLNTIGGNTTAYTWTATDSTVVGTAKTTGIGFNVIPTGTCLTGGVGIVTTFGVDAVTSQSSKTSTVAISWGDSLLQIAKSYAPTITAVYSEKLGFFPNGNPALPTGVTNAGRLGGALVFTNGTLPVTVDVIPNPSTISFCYAFKGRFPVPVSGQNTLFGLGTSASEKCMIGGFPLVLDATHLGFVSYNGAAGYTPTGYVIDTNEHDYMLVHNHTKSRLYTIVDGIHVGNVANTGIPAVACRLQFYCSAALAAEASMFAFGY